MKYVIAFALPLVAASAHAGGLLNGLGNMGAIANGYMNPGLAQQLQQVQALQQLQQLQHRLSRS